MINNQDISLLSDLDDPLGTAILADFLEQDFPGTADRLRISRVFPDAAIPLANQEKVGPLKDLWGIRDGTFIPTARHLEGPGNETTDRLCGCFLFNGEFPGKPVIPNPRRDHLRFREAVIRDPSFDQGTMRAFLDCPSFKNLSALALDGNISIGRGDAFPQSTLPNLRSLRWWSYYPRHSNEMEPLFANPFFSRLDAFHLYGSSITRIIVEDLTGSPAMRNLTRLGLHAPGLDAESMAVLTGWRGFQGLQSLYLAVPVGVGESWLEPLIKNAPSLKSLALQGAPGITRSLLQPLLVIKDRGLHSLSLSLLHVPDVVVEIMAAWAESGWLRELTLDRCSLSWRAHLLIGQRVLPHLKSFTINLEKWQPVQAGMLFSAGSDNLLDLDLQATQPIGALLKDWVPPAKFPNLMRLRWRALSPRGLSFFIAGSRQIRLVNQQLLE